MNVQTTTQTTYSPDIKHYFKVTVQGDKADVSTGVWHFDKNWSPSDLRAAAQTLLQVADIIEGGK